MSFGEKIDEVVIDTPVVGAQGIANIFERYGGMKYYNLAVAVVVAGISYWMYDLVNQYFAVENPAAFGLHAAIRLAASGFLLHGIWTVSRVAKLNTSEGRANPLRSNPRQVYLRSVTVALAVVFALTSLIPFGRLLVVDIVFLFYTVALFITACEEAPPPEHSTVPQT